MVVLLPTAAKHGSWDFHSIAYICANMYYHDSAHRLTGGIYSGLERSNKKKTIYDYYLCVVSVVLLWLVLVLRLLVLPLLINFFSLVHRHDSVAFQICFFLDFMIALRARWNSRDQLTDNYHIALIRDVSLEIYFIVAEILIHCLHAIDGYVWLLLSHSFSVSKDKQISSFFGNVAEERWNVIPSFSRDN